MNQTSVYENAAVTTQNKGRLIIMLYDGAIKFLNQAIHALETGDMEAKGKYIGRAQEIVIELNTILNMEDGGEISQNLRKLYNFILQHLTQANIKRDTQMILEVINLLKELNTGWKAIAN